MEKPTRGRHACAVSDVTGFRLLREPGRRVLVVIGPLDNLSGPTFERLVERAMIGPERVDELVVDLAASPFVTAAGFHSLLQAMSRASDKGCRVCVEHPRPLVETTIEVLGLDAVLCSPV